MKLFSSSEAGRAACRGAPPIVSVLDVGSSKICCLIARLTPAEDRARRCAAAPTRSRCSASATSARAASSPASSSISTRPSRRSGWPSTPPSGWPGSPSSRSSSTSPAGRLESETYSAASTRRQAVEEADIGRVLAAGRRHSVSDGPRRSSMRCRSATRSTATAASPIRAAWSASGSASTCTWSPATRSRSRNLELCINRCHLSVEALVATPYASGLAALVDDEAELGCACIDFGGGTTTIAVFNRRQVRPCRRHRRRRPAHHHRHRARPVDPHRGCRAAEDHARQRACRARSDEREMVIVPPIGDDDATCRTRCRARR